MGGAAFELERFEWAAGERIEVSGRWLGVRGMRFVRPTLTLRGSESRRLLAVLEHKPWAPDGDGWVAAFDWDGDMTGIDGAELSVAPGIEVVLPTPQPAKRTRAQSARKRGTRIEASGAAVAEAAGDVEPPPAPEPDTAPVARRPKRASAKAAAPTDDARVKQLESQVERLSRERVEATGARDSALADVIAMRDEIERERAQVERERADAVRERESLVTRDETALRERDEARAERDAAKAEVQAAHADRHAALRERDAAHSERDALDAELAALRAERDTAVARREAAVEERDAARRELAATPHRPGLVPLGHTEVESALALWTPRLIALALFIVFVAVVAMMFHGAP